jgi:hypothetical protein
MRATSTDLRRQRDGRRGVASALGACVGLSGIDHGIFEVLQGNTRTPGMLIPSIGPVQQMWEYGTEDAFTLVPNYLVTGILAIVLGALTLVWSLGFLARPRGDTVLLVLGLLTFAVGGGVGMLVFLLFGWAVARRIGQPARHRSRVPDGLRTAVSRLRAGLVGLGVTLYVVAIWIAITGVVPGMSDADLILAVCWGFLGGALALFAVALVGSAIPAVAGAPSGAASTPEDLGTEAVAVR